MSKIQWVCANGIGAFLGVLWFPATAPAAELAAAGTKGTLYVTVVVEGSGRVTSEGGGWEYLDWEVRNTAELRVEMTAQEGSMDAAKFAGLEGLGGDGGEEDQDWEEAWDNKIDACDGDEGCEMRVEMQKMQDPRFQASMGAAKAAMATMDFDDLGPTLQSWTHVNGTFTGTASIEWKTDTYGIVESTGGGPGESHCVVSGRTEVESKPTGYGDIAAPLTINSEDSSYELTLLEERPEVTVTEDCGFGSERSWHLSFLGGLAGGGTWSEVLKVKGLLSGSSDQPALSGTKVWSGEWQPGKETLVTVTWRFAP